MTERPILFSGPMVRAVLDGRKTQTRRVVKPQPPKDAVAPLCEAGWWMWQRFNAERRHYDGRTTEKLWDCRCPYGMPGDRLWVRETWAHDGPDLETVRARHEDAFGGGMTYGPYYLATEVAPDTLRWRPSIHMPRWASRITLEVTGIRVERLQDISEEDAEAEGVHDMLGKVTPWKDRLAPMIVHAFASTWESINGPGSWDANPFVWVLTFRRVGL